MTKERVLQETKREEENYLWRFMTKCNNLTSCTGPPAEQNSHNFIKLMMRR